MFGEVSFALGNQPSPADYSNMKPAFAHLAPTVPVAFAAAMAIGLSVFLLPGAAVQGEPTPLLAVIEGAAGRVAANLPAPVSHRASEPIRRAVAPTRPTATWSARLVPPRRQAVARTHRVHGHTRTRVARPTPSAPVQAAAPAAPATPVTTRRSFGNPKSAKGKARGHSHSHARALEPTVGTTAASAHGNGKAKALGRSTEHQAELPPGQAKKATTVPPPAPTSPPKSNGGGNGKNGGKK